MNFFLFICNKSRILLLYCIMPLLMVSEGHLYSYVINNNNKTPKIIRGNKLLANLKNAKNNHNNKISSMVMTRVLFGV